MLLHRLSLDERVAEVHMLTKVAFDAFRESREGSPRVGEDNLERLSLCGFGIARRNSSTDPPLLQPSSSSAMVSAEAALWPAPLPYRMSQRKAKGCVY